MPVTNQVPISSHTANGVTTVFAYDFKILSDDDLLVLVDGVEQSSGFSVSGVGDENGGDVTFSAAPESAALVVLKRNMAYIRERDFQENGDLLAQTLDDDQDAPVLMIQQLAEDVSRAPKFAPGVDADVEFPAIEALKLLRGNAAGDGLEFVEHEEGAGFSALRADLADPAQGADLIGFDADETVGDRLRSLPEWAQPRWCHTGFAYDYVSTSTMIYDGSTGDGLHRHFGQIAEGIDGRLHLVYGRSPTHGLTDGQTAWYRYSDDGGATWSDESEVVPAASGFDQRSLSLCVTPTGRLVLIYAKAVVPTGSPTVITLRYSDDNGATWAQGDDIVSIPYSYARTYGRIKLIPGNGDTAWRLAWTPYYRSGSGPTTYKVAAWYSDAADNGLAWAEGAPIVNDTSGQTECELVAINGHVWFAVTRGATGLTLYKTTDGGAIWTSVGVVTLTSSDSQVAPTLDKFEKDGSWFLVLGYCNRATDEMVWRVAAAAEAVTNASAFGSAIVGATDAVNASGYQCTVTKPDGSLYVAGGMAYVEFKEYVGQVYTQVRFVRLDLLALAAKTYLTLTIASGVITVPGNSLERIISVESEGASSLDELDTINGGRWGHVYVFQASQVSSIRDVVFKNGTGNLDLVSDFRANTSDSRIVLVKTGDRWVEVGRTNDDTEGALTIASDAITVPTAREVKCLLIDTEASAATDNLTTINGGREGQIIVLMSASSSRDTTIAEGGNVLLDAAGSFTLSNVADTITLVKRGTSWYEIARSDNS